MTATAEPLAEPAQSAPPLSDGRYTLGEIIGRGAAGTVRVAHDAKLDREVAIKSLDLHADAKARARFEREARAAGAIGHPNIVQVLDVTSLPDGTPCVVMERLRGETLADRIAREGPLSVLDALDVTLELLEALEAAHAAGVVHRDVKPANVMLALLGTGRTSVKLLDFGVLGLIESDAARLTAAGVVVGSPAYVPPECLREAASHRDVRGDVYAAGLTLYEALAGTPAFEAPSPVALRARILTSTPASIPSLRDDVPAPIVDALVRAMAREPSARFASARAFADALHAARPLLGAPAMDPPSPPLAPQPEPDALTHSQERDASPRAPTSTLAPSTLIGGRYRLLRPIGSGGMSDVYEAVDEHIARRVAVKVARGGVDIDRIAFARIEREARAAASLGHANIVGVLDLGIDATHGAYLVMELLAGESLLARLRRKGSLPSGEAIDVALQMLDGLAVAHAAGMTHRDVKPANVFLVPLASGGHLVKVLDFGIVKLREELAGPKLTHKGRAIGTPAYMPPEQLHLGTVDGRADVYAVGVTLYEMLTGALPTSDTLPLGRPMVLPPLHGAAVSHEGLAKILAQAMAADPARRYPHAGAMRDALVQIKPGARPTAMSLAEVPRTAIAAPSHLGTRDAAARETRGPGEGTLARLGLRDRTQQRAALFVVAMVALAVSLFVLGRLAAPESATATARPTATAPGEPIVTPSAPSSAAAPRVAPPPPSSVRAVVTTAEHAASSPPTPAEPTVPSLPTPARGGLEPPEVEAAPPSREPSASRVGRGAREPRETTSTAMQRTPPASPHEDEGEAVVLPGILDPFE